MKKNIFVVTAIVVSIAYVQSCNDSGNSKKATSDTATQDNDAMTSTHNAGTTGEHNQMLVEMNTMTMTGDFDLDFATMMIPHHQNAVDMAELYLAKGKDEKIKSMAQNIISSQKKEMEDLRNMIANHKTSGKNDEHVDKSHGNGEHDELMQAMNTMMDRMKAIQNSGDADKDFVTMMIPHHESAVMMAENEISHGKNIDLKKMAKKIVVDQNMEIKQFKEWLAKIK